MRTFIIRTFFCLVLLSVFMPTSKAATAFVLKKADTEISLGSGAEFLRDPSATLSIHDVVGESRSNDFKSVQAATPNFGLTTDAIWLRVRVKNPLPDAATWYLEIAYPLLDEIDVYVHTGEEPVRVARVGDRLPFVERPLLYRNFVVPLELPHESEVEIFVRVQTESSVQIPLTLWRPQSFVEHVNKEIYALGIYFGIMLVMILYNFFIYLSVRDRSYLYYVLYIIGYSLFQMTWNGLAFEHIWPESPLWGNKALIFFLAFQGLFMIAFASSFLGSRQGNPRLHRLFWGGYAIGAVLLAIAFFAPYSVGIKIGMVYSLVTVTAVMANGAVALFNGHKPARFFMLAWSVFLIGIFLAILKTVGVLSTNYVTEWAVQIGSALEVILLSLGLADRINVLQAEARRAQEEVVRNQTIAIDNLRRADQIKDEFFREVVSTRRSLRDLVAEGRRISSLVSLQQIVQELSGAFGKVSGVAMEVRSYFSPICWGGRVENHEHFFAIPNGEVEYAGPPVSMADMSGEHTRIIPVKDPRTADTLAFITIEYFDSIVLDRSDAAFEALGNNLASAINTVRLELTFSELERRTREMRSVFRCINQGLCIMDNTMRIGPEFSAATVSFFETENLAGQDAIALLFKEAKVSGDVVATTRSTLAASFGEDEMVFDMNSGNLPKELEIQRDNRQLWYEVDWTAITDADDEVRQILLTIRDVTMIRKLRAEAAQNMVQIEILQQIVSVPPESYYRFVSNVKDYLACCDSLLSNPPLGDEQVREIKRYLHTIKGNARTMKFHEIINVTHEVESRVFDLVEHNRVLAQNHVTDVSAWMEMIKNKVALYEDVNDRKLRRNRDNDRRRTESVRVLTNFVRESLEEKDNSGVDIEPYRLAFVDLVRTVYSTFFTLVRGQLDGSVRIIEQLGIPSPRLHLQIGEDWVIAGKYADVIYGVFGHLIGNSLDHGFACLPKRRTGTIVISGGLTEHGGEIVYRDDGAGLNMNALRTKGLERGLLRPDSTDVDVAEVIFERGLSTAECVTTISGRGVGLDAARKLLTRNGGSLRISLGEIRAETGFRDFAIHIRLPKEAILFAIDAEHETESPVIDTQ